jgi:hypothetical protein
VKNGYSGEKPLFRTLVPILKRYLRTRTDDNAVLFVGRQGRLSKRLSLIRRARQAQKGMRHPSAYHRPRIAVSWQPAEGAASTAARSRSRQILSEDDIRALKRIESSAPRVDKDALLKRIKTLGGGWKFTDEAWTGVRGR